MVKEELMMVFQENEIDFIISKYIKYEGIIQKSIFDIDKIQQKFNETKARERSIVEQKFKNMSDEEREIMRTLKELKLIKMELIDEYEREEIAMEVDEDLFVAPLTQETEGDDVPEEIKGRGEYDDLLTYVYEED